MEIWVIALGLLLVAGAIAVLFERSLKAAIITFGIVSLLSALLFTLMRAYDVAITEASIGAVLTTAIFFWSLRRLEEDGFNEKD